MIAFDKKVECGPSYVALREVDSKANKEIDLGGIVIAESAFSNDKLAHYVVEDVGKIAAYEYGLEVGDYVLADKQASFYHSRPVCIMAYNNVILKTDKDMSEVHVVKNKVLVVEDEAEVKNESGFFVRVDQNVLHTGKIVEMNVVPPEDAKVKDFPFKVGDHVLLTKKGDFIQLGDERYWVYSPDDILCKFEK